MRERGRGQGEREKGKTGKEGREGERRGRREGEEERNGAHWPLRSLLILIL